MKRRAFLTALLAAVIPPAPAAAATYGAAIPFVPARPRRLPGIIVWDSRPARGIVTTGTVRHQFGGNRSGEVVDGSLRRVWSDGQLIWKA